MALPNKVRRRIDDLMAAMDRELTVKAARERSAGDPERIYWVQLAWQGAERRCWRWDGWWFGVRVIALVWIESRGYCVRDVSKNHWVGDFDTLDEATEAGMLTATDNPAGASDFSAELECFRVIRTHEQAQRRAEDIQASAQAIAAAAPAVNEFNEKFSAAARQRAACER
jgi:hypothetical protein